MIPVFNILKNIFQGDYKTRYQRINLFSIAMQFNLTIIKTPLDANVSTVCNQNIKCGTLFGAHSST